MKGGNVKNIPNIVIPSYASLVIDELDLREIGEVIDSVMNYFILDRLVDVTTGSKIKDLAIKMIIEETESKCNEK